MYNQHESLNEHSCVGSGAPLAAHPPSLADALNDDDGSVSIADGSGMDVATFKDLRARALTLGSILQDEDEVTAEHFFLPFEWEEIAEDYGHVMERGLALLADLYFIPFIPVQDDCTGEHTYIFVDVCEAEL